MVFVKLFLIREYRHNWHSNWEVFLLKMKKVGTVFSGPFHMGGGGVGFLL